MPTWHTLLGQDPLGRPRQTDQQSLLADLITDHLSAPEVTAAPAVEPELPPVAPPPEVAGPSRADQASRLAQDIAYGRSDWERAGQALMGSDRFEEASGLRRTGAILGGVGLGTLALMSWIPGFNVFKPAQAARAARAFGQGAVQGGRAGTGILRGGWDEASELERARRAARTGPDVSDIQVTERAAPPPEDPSVEGLRRLFRSDIPTPLDTSDAQLFSQLGTDPIFRGFSARSFVRGPSEPSSRSFFEPNVEVILRELEAPRRHWDSALNKEVLVPRGGGIYQAARPIIERHAENFIRFDPDPSAVNDFVRRISQEAVESPEWAAEYFGRQTTFSALGWQGASPQQGLYQRGHAYARAHNDRVFDRMMQEIEDAYPALKTAQGAFPLYSPRHAGDLDSFVQVFNSADVRPVMTIWEPGLEGALRDGNILNQFLTNSTSGYFGPGARITSEMAISGINPSVGPLGRPVYGYLAAANPAAVDGASPVVRNAIQEFGSLDITAPYMYGDIELVFRPDVLRRTTFTIDDSLSMSMIAAPLDRPITVTDASLASLRPFGRISPTEPGGEAISYFETQMIRPLLTDVEKIVLHSRDAAEYARLRDKIAQGFRSAIGDVPEISTILPEPGFPTFTW